MTIQIWHDGKCTEVEGLSGLRRYDARRERITVREYNGGSAALIVVYDDGAAAVHRMSSYRVAKEWARMLISDRHIILIPLGECVADGTA